MLNQILIRSGSSWTYVVLFLFFKNLLEQAVLGLIAVWGLIWFNHFLLDLVISEKLDYIFDNSPFFNVQ